MKYPVEKNDTIKDFADRYNLTVQRLRDLNTVADGGPASLAVDVETALLADNLELEIGGRAQPFPNGAVINDDLYNLYGTTLDDLRQLNDGVSAKLQQCAAAKLPAHRKLNNIEYLVVPNALPQQAQAVPVVNPLPVEPNPDFDWLTYETRFNAPSFMKEKTPVAYGLYALPVDHRAEIVASRVLPEALAKAFFPGMTVDEVLALSDQSCRWRRAPAVIAGHGPNSGAVQQVGAAQAVIHAPQMMVMPYNYFANDLSSSAIGTNLAMEIEPGPQFRLLKHWPLWETASRSSISKLEPTTEADLAPAGRLPAQWPFRSRKAPDGNELDVAYLNKAFKLGTLSDCYSVKTGVCWLGKERQNSVSGAGKDVLETNALLASMRSDWVEYVEAAVGTDAMLTVLRELLTVTFPNRVSLKRDGYQIRDLAPLAADKLYFPPLSIPYAGEAFVAAYNAKNPNERLDFGPFWEAAYATALGRAKAELLLRYGLQLTTPNPQNFLLEFDKATLKPTGKVVLRDIGDAKLHSEVIGQIGLGQAVIDYEMTDPERAEYLPAQTNNEGRADDHGARHDRFDQYPLNTRTHWHQYSAFKEKYGGDVLPGNLLTTISWGRAHYAAYAAHLAVRLGLPDLSTLPFSEAAYQRVLAATEPEPNKSKGENAKRALPKLHAEAGSAAAITVDTYRGLIGKGECSNLEALHAEWAFEVHSDELLHARLSSPEALAAIKAKWTR